jgi:hypothetical protein
MALLAKAKANCCPAIVPILVSLKKNCANILPAKELISKFGTIPLLPNPIP